MLKTLYHNKSFNANQKNQKITNHFLLEKTLTPIKLVSKYKEKINKENNFVSNIIKSKPQNLYLKNNNKNIKLQILNHSIKNSRNISSLNSYNINGIFPNKNYNSFQTNNSFSFATNLKTTMDSNATKNQNLKEKLNNKQNLSSFIDTKTSTFFSSSFKGWKKGKEKTINQIKNISKIKKRPKIKIYKTKTNYFNNIKGLKKNNINEKNNNSFIFPKRIDILKNIHNNILTPIRKNTKKNYRNSISLNKKINKIEKNINIINKKQKIIDKNKIIINKNKLKNIYILLEKQKESTCNKDKIMAENEFIEKIKNQIKAIKNNTLEINMEANILNKELIKIKKEINMLKLNIVNTINDKKNANTMIILLHKRIIDINKRIKEYDEESNFLDKSIYEISLKYQDANTLSK